jgi:hypothetical protein
MTAAVFIDIVFPLSRASPQPYPQFLTERGFEFRRGSWIVCREPEAARVVELGPDTIAEMRNLEPLRVGVDRNRAELDMAAYGLPDWPIMRAPRH